MRLFATLLSLVLLALAPAVPAAAQEAPPAVKGLFLLTDYPAITVRPGTSTTINLRLRNYALDPDRYALTVGGVPQGWTATLLGGGQPVAAAMVATNDSTALQLRLDVPENASMGTTANLTVVAKGSTVEKTLPIAVSLAKDLPAKLTIKAQLPSLRGTSKSSFEFQMEVKNDSGRNLVISLGAQAPRNFETSFTEQYGSQELSSIPIDAGQSKTVKLKVRPPSTTGANRYPVSVKASAEDASADTTVALEITGQPQLAIAGRDGVLSGRAEAGKESAIPIIVTNNGTAPADEITLSSSAPSGWKIEFDPKTLDQIAPGTNKEAQVRVTPPEKAIAGDYAPTFTATSRGETASTQFRVAVSTSTMWGIAGAGIIAIALLILVGAVARFRPAMSDIVIEAQGLTKRYGRATAVNGISFSVARGEIFGLLGPNGAGKTTTILMMLGLTEVTGGTVRVLGRDPVREPLQVKRHVGYLPNSVGFYEYMTAVDNLRYTAALVGFEAAEREKRVMSALDRVGLADVAYQRVATYSRGMRQRLGLAEILMKDSQIAILDEPTSGLDPQATNELLEMIRSLKRDGVAVLISSHLLERVQSVCDRVALFQSGNIVLLGTVPELARQVLGGGYNVDVEADGEGLAQKFSEMPGVRAVDQPGPSRYRLLAERDIRAEAAAVVVNAGGRLRQLAVEVPSLDTIYSHYFQNQTANPGAQNAA